MVSHLSQVAGKVEEDHKSIKSLTSFARSPTRRIRTQTNHFTASILAFVKLEAWRATQKLNHVALKDKLYRTALAGVFTELRQLKMPSPVRP